MVYQKSIKNLQNLLAIGKCCHLLRNLVKINFPLEGDKEYGNGEMAINKRKYLDLFLIVIKEV